MRGILMSIERGSKAMAAQTPDSGPPRHAHYCWLHVKDVAQCEAYTRFDK